MTVHIRPALPADIAILVEFNRRMAWETEQKTLAHDVLTRGVAAVFADPARGFYLLAEHYGRAGRAIDGYPRVERLAQRRFLVDSERLRP